MTIGDVVKRQSEGDTTKADVEFLLNVIGRLRFALGKTSDWAGVDIQELIDEGYIKEGDF